MTKVNWSDESPGGERLEDWLRENYPRLTNQELMNRLEVRLGWRPRTQTIAMKAWRMGLAKSPEVISEALHERYSKVVIPESVFPRWDEPPRVPQPALLLFDIHAPFQDGKWMSQCINLAKHWGIETCLLGGDFVDNNAFSPWGKDAELFAEAEFRASEAVLDAIADAFKAVIYIWGNHEERVKRLLGRDLAASRFLRLLTKKDNVLISEYWWALVGEKWIAAHPGNASVMHGRVPVWLAEKYDRHLAAGHGHLQGDQWTRSGRLLGIDVGVCADPTRLEYTNRKLNTRPAVNQGALILVNERPWRLHPEMTDFPLMECLGEALRRPRD